MAVTTWILALDIGKQKTGVAVGQSLTKTAKPLSIIRRPVNELRAAALDTWIKEWSVSAVVIGQPVLKDGTEHPLYSAIQRIAHDIKQRFDLPVYFIDEYLSSHEAKARAPNIKHIDAVAAAVIAEDWFASNTQAE